jgi:hypothetical protein
MWDWTRNGISNLNLLSYSNSFSMVHICLQYIQLEMYFQYYILEGYIVYLKVQRAQCTFKIIVWFNLLGGSRLLSGWSNAISFRGKIQLCKVLSSIYFVFLLKRGISFFFFFFFFFVIIINKSTNYEPPWEIDGADLRNMLLILIHAPCINLTLYQQCQVDTGCVILKKRVQVCVYSSFPLASNVKV